jgi:hypothetical protein
MQRRELRGQRVPAGTGQGHVRIGLTVGGTAL